MEGDVVHHGGAVDIAARASDDEVLTEAQSELGGPLQIALHPDAAVDLALEDGAVAVEQHGDALDQVDEDLVLAGLLGLGVPGNGLVGVVGGSRAAEGRQTAHHTAHQPGPGRGIRQHLREEVRRGERKRGERREQERREERREQVRRGERESEERREQERREESKEGYRLVEDEAFELLTSRFLRIAVVYHLVQQLVDEDKVLADGLLAVEAAIVLDDL